MNIKILKIGLAGLLIGLFLFTFNAELIPQEEGELRMDEVRSVKMVKGRIDSVREDKIVITYEPADQEGVQLQTYYLRDANTTFVNRQADALEAGDIVEVTYEEAKWSSESGKKRVERVAKSVRFIRSRAMEEIRKKAEEMAVPQEPVRSISEDEEL